MENPYDLTPPKYQEPPRARTIRRAARAALKGHWFRMALVALVFLLLTTSYVNISFGRHYNYDLPDEYDPDTSSIELLADDYFPRVEAAVEVKIGPLGYSYRAPIDMPTLEYLQKSFFESMFMDFRTGWAAIPGAIQSAIFAAGALTFVLLLFRPVLRLGLYESISSLYSGEHPRVSQLFSKMRFFGKALWLGILEVFFMFLWTLLLIVPGIIAGYRYAMAFYILWNNPDMRAIDALRESKRRMDGNKGRLFCLQLSYIGWTLLAVVPMAVVMVVFSVTSIFFPQSLLLWPLPMLVWVTSLIGDMFLMSYEYVGEFEFFKDLEANGNGGPV